MKRNNMIRKTICSIIFNIVFIIVTGVIWGKFNVGEYEEIAKYYENPNVVSYDVVADNGYMLNTLSNYGKVKNDIVINISNDTYINDDYEIALALEKNIEYDKLYVDIDGILVNLKDIFVESDNDLNYFLIVKNSIIGENVKYNIGFYIDSEDIDYFIDKNIEMNFVDLTLNKI